MKFYKSQSTPNDDARAFVLEDTPNPIKFNKKPKLELGPLGVGHITGAKGKKARGDKLVCRKKYKKVKSIVRIRPFGVPYSEASSFSDEKWTLPDGSAVASPPPLPEGRDQRRGSTYSWSKLLN